MKVFITDSNRSSTLSIIDPKTGENFIRDFLNHGSALDDGSFSFDEPKGAFICSEETFIWWEKVAQDNQKLLERTRDLEVSYGEDKVRKVFDLIDGVSLEEYASTVSAALDRAFGSQSRDQT